MIDPWAKKGDVVEHGQAPWLYLVLRRRQSAEGLVYDLRAIMPSGLAGTVRGVLAWRCRRIPRPPALPGEDTRTIDDIARGAIARAEAAK